MLYMGGNLLSIKWKSKIIDGICVVAGLVLPAKKMKERNAAITLINHTQQIQAKSQQIDEMYLRNYSSFADR